MHLTYFSNIVLKGYLSHMLKCDAAFNAGSDYLYSLNVATIDISYSVTEICIPTQKKAMSSVCSQKMAACFTLASVTNRLQSQVLLNGSEELETTVPRYCRWELLLVTAPQLIIYVLSFLLTDGHDIYNSHFSQLCELPKKIPKVTTRQS
jgi:hypothetical protein